MGLFPSLVVFRSSRLGGLTDDHLLDNIGFGLIDMIATNRVPCLLCQQFLFLLEECRGQQYQRPFLNLKIQLHLIVLRPCFGTIY